MAKLDGFAQGAGSAETLANLVAHLFAELFAARRPFVFGNIMAVEDVEVFQDRVTIARHRQDPAVHRGRLIFGRVALTGGAGVRR